MKKNILLNIITILIFLIPNSLKADLTENIEEMFNEITPSFGSLISGGILTSAYVPNSGKFSFAVGVNASIFDINDPQNINEQIKFGYPKIYFEGVVGIYSGKYLPSGITFGKIALIGRYGFLPVPGAIGSNVEYNTLQTWSIGSKIGLLQNNLLYPDISIQVLYTNLSKVELFLKPLSQVDTTFYAAVTPYSISADLSISKRLLFLSPYFSLGVNYTSLNAEYNISPPSSKAGSVGEDDSENNIDFKVNSTSISWKGGFELYLIPILNTEIEVGQTGGKWNFAGGLRVKL